MALTRHTPQGNRQIVHHAYAGDMTSLRRLLIASSVLVLAACGTGSKTVANTATPEVTAVTSQAADPNLVSDDDSGVDCTELGLDGYAMVMQQSSMTIDDQAFQIASVSCMSDAGEGSAWQGHPTQLAPRFQATTLLANRNRSLVR